MVISFPFDSKLSKPNFMYSSLKNCSVNGFGRASSWATNNSLYGSIRDKMAGLPSHLLMLKKKLFCSSVVGLIPLFLFTGRSLNVIGTFPLSVRRACFCLADDKSISDTGKYGISFTWHGISHLFSDPVQVMEFCILAPVSQANSIAPMWEHASLRPAIRSLWPVRTVSFFFAKIHAFKGVSRALWEWFTWQ